MTHQRPTVGKKGLKEVHNEANKIIRYYKIKYIRLHRLTCWNCHDHGAALLNTSSSSNAIDAFCHPVLWSVTIQWECWSCWSCWSWCLCGQVSKDRRAANLLDGGDGSRKTCDWCDITCDIVTAPTTALQLYSSTAQSTNSATRPWQWRRHRLPCSGCQ